MSFGVTTSQQASPVEMEGPSKLASLMQLPPLETHFVLSKALDVIQNMESKPTCNRLAAQTLIRDCKDLEQSPEHEEQGTEVSVDYLQQQYAARIAACELSDAYFSLPKVCSILTPSPEGCRTKSRWANPFARQKIADPTQGPCYPEHSRIQLQNCLRALVGTEQSWTSYSNSKQNAMLMCQASRSAIDRNKDLAAYKNLTQVVHDMEKALVQSLEKWNESATEVMQQVKEVHISQRLSKENAQTMHSNIENMIAMLRTLSEESSTMHLRTNAAFEKLRQETESHVQDLIQGSLRNLASKYEVQSQQQYEHFALSKEAMLHGLRHAMEPLYGAMESLRTQMGSIQGLVDSVYNRAFDAESKAALAEERATAAGNAVDAILNKVGYLDVKLESSINRFDAFDEKYEYWQAKWESSNRTSASSRIRIACLSLLMGLNLYGLSMFSPRAAGIAIVTSCTAGLIYLCGAREWLQGLLVHADYSGVLPRPTPPASLSEVFQPFLALVAIGLTIGITIGLLFIPQGASPNAQQDTNIDAIQDADVGTPTLRAQRHSLRSALFRAFW